MPEAAVPINVTINRPDTVTVNGVTVTNVPGGNTRGTQRPGSRCRMSNPVPEERRDAGSTPQRSRRRCRARLASLPRNFLRGPRFWQLDLMASKDVRFGAGNQGIQFRIEVFNIANRLNYENPAAVLPAGTIGQPFTDAAAGDVRLHARSAESHRGSRHGSPDAICCNAITPPLYARWRCGARARHAIGGVHEGSWSGLQSRLRAGARGAGGDFSGCPTDRVAHRGRLTDSSGAALPGVTVTVTAAQTGATRVVVSEGAGDFAITNLGPGAYSVLIELAGFASAKRNIVLGLGQVETVDLKLGVAAVTELVTVTAAANVIDVSRRRRLA